MQQVIDEIRKFNQERRLLDKVFCLDNEINFLEEEIKEFSESTTDEDRIDALADLVVFAVGICLKCGCTVHLSKVDYILLSPKELLERLKKNTDELKKKFNTERLSFNSELLRIYLNQLLGAIQSFEYDPEKVLIETCKHINSEEGGRYDPISGKYLKGKRTYQPDYGSCKLQIS